MSLLVFVIPAYSQITPQPTYLKSLEKDGTYLRIPQIVIPNSLVTEIDTPELYQFNVTLNQKVLTNTFSFPIETHGLKFVYQPPLNEELDEKEYDLLNETHAIKDGVTLYYRPLNVVGSYAIFKNDSLSSGKIYHLYRPLIVDANKNTLWADLTLTETALTVSINQTWLQSAIFPLTIDPSFGKTDVGATQTSRTTGYASGSTYQVTEGDGEIDSVSVWINATSGAGNMKVAVYAGGGGFCRRFSHGRKRGTGF